ncbi:MAG: extracellular solute-binding protein [Candidatus Omnitrophica bacterium]|nr:extracellular solute-binding protein [Candidatus Omnitrophota bacterium]
MKKIFSLVILFAICCLLSTATACSPRVKTPHQKQLIVWHWMTDRQEAFEKLAEQYEKEKGLKVKFDLYAPSDAYRQKVMAGAQTNTLPDIYGILGEKKFFASFIHAGYVANLSDAMNANNKEWKQRFFEKAISVNEFSADNEFGIEAGIYGVPLDVMNIQMLYNKDIFKKAGLDPHKPPRTWKEFIANIKQIKQKTGVAGLVSGWGEIWMIDCLASNYAFNIMGEEKVMATIRGEVSYTDSDWIKVLNLFKEMSEKKILAKGIVTMVNKTAEQMFANQKAAFAFNGSWCVNVYQGMNPNLNYAAMLPPAVSSQNPMVIWGAAGSSFMANAKSSQKEEAIEFLKWLTQKKQQVLLCKETNNLPANKNSLSDISSILQQFADDMDNTTHPNIWVVSEKPIVVETFDKGIQSIIIGEKTPFEVAKEIQAAKEKEMSRPHK